MQTPATAEEFQDFTAHKQMWAAFTRFVVRGVIAVAITVVVVGLITGVL